MERAPIMSARLPDRPDYHVARRTQFSSCDGCRRARVACDASRFGYQPGEADWGGSCSRCATRARRCTFEWMKKAPRRHRHHSSSRPAPTSSAIDLERGPDLPDHRGPVPHGASIGGEHTNDISDAIDLRRGLASRRSVFCAETGRSCNVLPSGALCSDAEAELIDKLLERCGDVVFSNCFGAIFGRWVGRDGCPLVDEPTSDISVSPLKLFVRLDAFMDEQVAQSPSHLPATVVQRLGRDELRIDRCLRSALHAYISRWVPLFLPTELECRHSAQRLDEVSRSCWRTARKDMLKAINLPSYQSVLALYLFGQTPVPLGISQEEELDGISGVVCSKTALLHVQKLRERQRCCQFNGSEISAWSDASPNHNSTNQQTAASPTTLLTEEYLNLESRAYWATVTWDTSDSMTLNFRSTLSSGLKGACAEPVWQLARSFVVGVFHERTHVWRLPGFRVSSDVAPQIMSAASVCTIYTWKTIASLKEALREGVNEAGVQFGWDGLLDAVGVFKTTVHPILRNYERQLHFLGQVDRLHWYEIVLLYYLGILILADALEAAHRLDLLRQLEDMGLEAEYECFNVLKFGLESTYTLMECGPQVPSSNSAAEPAFPGQTVTVPFVAIDPYPQHVVAAVMLMGKAFQRQYSQDSITHEAYSHLDSTLQEALRQLPRNSKAIKSAKHSLRKLLASHSSASESPTN